MIGTRRIRSARVTALVAAGTLGFAGVVLGAAPTAFAESAVSPTGMVAVSVPPPVVAGLPSTYTLTFTNTTSSTMSGIVAEGDLPAGMTLKNINNCARLGGNQTIAFLCSMPNLAAGASESATFSILASSIGTYDLPFTVSGGVPIPGSPGALQIIGDSVTLAVSVQPGPTDLQVTGSSNNGSPPVGSSFTYTYQVKDNGPLPAFGVTFNDTLPPSLHLAGTVSVDVGTCTASTATNSVHCDIGGLAVGQQSTISFAATPTTTGVFGDTGTVAMTGTDTQPANNSFTVTVQPK
ncbi:MAG TPA: DUF11 domain-containing protein [Acidimicrobiales bacterium]|nr:DUF11 domain-containing protein [Acidimicrobiales bacterium]